MKNVGKSVRAKLYRISIDENINYQHLIIRYLHERLLYRISISKYSPNFCLKGGTLLYAINEKKAQRYTLDIDFALQNLAYNENSVVKAMQEICKLSDNDGVNFDYEKITISEIKENTEYGGLRVFIPAKLDTIRQRLQLDVGFGDKISPDPHKINFPVLIENSLPPIIFAYSSETIIAEKFHAMIELADLNSRLKDFYDVYKLLISNNYNEITLEQAIKTTFANRNTVFSENHSLFSEEFANNEKRKTMWFSFLKKINEKEQILFTDIMILIKKKLYIYWLNL